MKYYSFNQKTLIGRVKSVREIAFTNGTKAFSVELATWRWKLDANQKPFATEEVHAVTIPGVKKHREFVLNVIPDSILFVQGQDHRRLVPSTKYPGLMAIFWDLYADFYIPLGGGEEGHAPEALEQIVRQSAHPKPSPHLLRFDPDPQPGMGEER